MNNIIRAFVVTLTLTGAVASAHTVNTDLSVAKPKPSSLPKPVCNPGVPDGCGMGW